MNVIAPMESTTHTGLGAFKEMIGVKKKNGLTHCRSNPWIDAQKCGFVIKIDEVVGDIEMKIFG